MEQIPSANPLVQHDRFPARHTNPFYNPWQNTILAQEHFPRFWGEMKGRRGQAGSPALNIVTLSLYKMVYTPAAAPHMVLRRETRA